MTEYKYTELTSKIIGASYEVHKFFGCGFQEVIYQRALACELNNCGLKFSRELEQDIYYKNYAEPIGKRRVDFMVENKVLLELKAVNKLDDVHFAQLLNYLKIYRLDVGLLLNFGARSLEVRRVALTHLH